MNTKKLKNLTLLTLFSITTANACLCTSPINSAFQDMEASVIDDHLKKYSPAIDKLNDEITKENNTIRLEIIELENLLSIKKKRTLYDAKFLHEIKEEYKKMSVLLLTNPSMLPIGANNDDPYSPNNISNTSHEKQEQLAAEHEALYLTPAGIPDAPMYEENYSTNNNGEYLEPNFTVELPPENDTGFYNWDRLINTPTTTIKLYLNDTHQENDIIKLYDNAIFVQDYTITNSNIQDGYYNIEVNIEGDGLHRMSAKLLRGDIISAYDNYVDLTLDTVIPHVTITSNNYKIASYNETITYTFTEDMPPIISYAKATNGTFENEKSISEDLSVYTLDFKPTLFIQVNENYFYLDGLQDLAGNPLSSSEKSLNYAVDSIYPYLDTVTYNGTDELTLTFSEKITLIGNITIKGEIFTASSIPNSNETTSFTIPYTHVYIEDDEPNNYVFNIPNDSFIDYSGNKGVPKPSSSED